MINFLITFFSGIFRRSFFLPGFFIFFLLWTGCGDDILPDEESGSDGDSAFIFSAGSVRGDIGFSNMKTACRLSLRKLGSSMTKNTVVPLISSAENGSMINLLPQNPNRKIRSALNKGLTVADQWSDLWTSPPSIQNPISTSDFFWYTGTNRVGALVDAGSCGNGNWTGGIGGGVIGRAGKTDAQWISYISKNCTESHTLLCITYD